MAKCVGLAIVGIVVCACTSAALAQPTDSPSQTPPAATSSPPSARDRAIALFKRGLDLYAAGDYVGSRIEFQRAYDAAPNYKVLYNIGQVCFQLKRLPVRAAFVSRLPLAGRPGDLG